ncbi:MAG TPA: ATP-binding cassette domain-containing protein [Acidimicrobiales bacterium]|nr:ATP-binding cassette domain-containing protein [Acidimicrobiales bacterium]
MSDDTAPVLEARDVTVRFGGLTALSSVTVTVPPGCLIGLVGPNGAGKSTLFGVCSGLIRPADGRVYVAGREVTGASPQARARLGLARTFQQPEMFMGLTVRQHLTLAYRVRKNRSRLWKDMFSGAGLRKPDKEENDRVESLLDLLGLHDLAETVVDVLPLGTTRLVEVGRALAGGPTVVLLDEPLSGLDAAEALRLAEALRRTVRDEGISLLLVEHDVAMVLSLCSTIHVLDFGQLIAVGTPEQVRADPVVKAAYLGEDPVAPAGRTGASGEPVASPR